MDNTPDTTHLYSRRFGAEIELNAFDSRDFKANPLRKYPPEMPEGTEQIGTILAQAAGDEIRICRWHNTHNNSMWILKPDSSCGLEICSPVLKGNIGVSQVYKIIDALANNADIVVDNRCSFHVHVNVDDLTHSQISVVLAYWLKCEHVFLNSVPANRKNNRYCHPVSRFDWFQTDTPMSSKLILEAFAYKYGTVNVYHLNKEERRTIEFRIAEEAVCLDADAAKNWIWLVLHFVEVCSQMPMPEKYAPDNKWSSYLWLDESDVIHLLGFADDDLSAILPPEIVSAKKWFCERLRDNRTIAHTNI